MILNRSVLGILIFLATLVILTSWYSVKLSTIIPTHIATFEQTGNLEQGSVVQTNDQGLISYQATVTKATQIGANKVYFYDLQGTSYDSKRTPWLLSADQGVVAENNEEIILTGHVKLIRTTTPGNPQISFNTSSANIFPKTQKINGDDWLTITQQGSLNSLTGKGFEGDFANKTYRLLSQVKGIYYAHP
jgi:LPS export ABC transporter protein LptC